MIQTDMENMVLIIGRKQTDFKTKSENTPLGKITLDDIWPTLKIAAANADVVIIKDGSEYAVLKHRYIDQHQLLEGMTYHITTIRNIAFARKT
jgi:hypothetical protein